MLANQHTSFSVQIKLFPCSTSVLKYVFNIFIVDHVLTKSMNSSPLLNTENNLRKLTWKFWRKHNETSGDWMLKSRISAISANTKLSKNMSRSVSLFWADVFTSRGTNNKNVRSRRAGGASDQIWREKSQIFVDQLTTIEHVAPYVQKSLSR